MGFFFSTETANVNKVCFPEEVSVSHLFVQIPTTVCAQMHAWVGAGWGVDRWMGLSLMDRKLQNR